MSSQANLLLKYDYSANLLFQAQQKESKLEYAVTRGFTDGEKKRHQLIGAVDPVQITERHQATPYVPTPHDDRWSVQTKWVLNDWFDDWDRARSAVSDADSKYIQNNVRGLNRKKDALILTALGGTAVTGQTGTGTQSLPGGQKVTKNSHTFDPAAGSADVGLTVYKLQNALAILEGDHGGLEDFKCHIALPAKQKHSLMSSTKIVSSLYNDNKSPLTTNQLADFLGCEIHLYADSLIKLDGSSDELVYVWLEEGIAVDFPDAPMQTRLNEDLTKNYSIQCWACMALGAVRLDDKMVVEIACDPTPTIVG